MSVHKTGNKFQAKTKGGKAQGPPRSSKKAATKDAFKAQRFTKKKKR